MSGVKTMDKPKLKQLSNGKWYVFGDVERVIGDVGCVDGDIKGDVMGKVNGRVHRDCALSPLEWEFVEESEHVWGENDG